MSDINTQQYKHTQYKLTYKLLTPVHIGTGETINPLSYVIDENNIFHRFRIEKLIASFSAEQRKKFIGIVKTGNLVNQREFIRKNYCKEADSYSFPVEKNVADWYKNRLSQYTSYLEINPFIRVGGDGEPYLPGSSIKGAIRTALLDAMALRKQMFIPKKDKFKNKVEGKLLNCLNYKDRFDVIKDPFKYLKVTDVFFKDKTANVQINKVVNTGTKEKGVEQYCEALYPLNSEKKPIKAYGTLTIMDEFKKRVCCMKEIADRCKLFYMETLEHDTMKPEWLQKFIIETCNAKNQFPICLGRFTGKHYKTYTNAKEKYPGTRNLLKKSLPLGWIMVEYVQI